MTGILLRGIAASICLLPPTLLMGATLPAMARWVESTPEGVSWLGFFYGGNIAGGVIGCLLAGFYLLRVHDIAVATFVAVGLNVLVAGLALVIAKAAPHVPAAETAPARGSNVRPARGPVYVAIGLSGMTALGAEVIWTRLLSLLFGATVYTFSLILAVFLLGLGIGSSIGSAIAGAHRAARGSRSAGASCCSAPRWPGRRTCSRSRCRTGRSIRRSRPTPGSTSSSISSAASGRSCPARSCGARAFRSRSRRSPPAARIPARLVGGVYAANTLGAIIGSVTASLLLVVWLGSQRAQQVLVIVSAVSALLDARVGGRGGARRRRSRFQFAGTLLLAAAMGGAVLLARTIHAVPGVLVAYGRYAATRIGEAEIIYVGEGWNASVAVSRLSNGVLNYHNAGKVQASSEPQDMRLQRMLGHMTTLIPKNPESVLVIGCGAGVTAGAVSVDPQRQAPHDRRDRAARPAGRLELFQRSTTSTSSTTRRRTSSSTTRGISC